MVFEDPLNSLDPAFTVGDQIGETLMLHKAMTKSAARQKAGELLRLVGIPDPERRLDNYAHELSGGMQQRVMIAVALSCDPALLIADNPTTALDVTIQMQILDLVKQLRDRLGMAVLWITHDLGVVAKLCDRVVIMYAGKVMEAGDVYDVLKRPRHPYTRRLIDALPKLGPPGAAADPDRGPAPESRGPAGRVPVRARGATRSPRNADRTRWRWWTLGDGRPSAVFSRGVTEWASAGRWSR